MHCPFCLAEKTNVLDSRESQDFEIRRRRECNGCEKRFTTYEQTDASLLTVEKRSGKHEEFDAEKLRNGIRKACKKRDVSDERIDAAAAEIESQVRYEADDGKVTSQQIGERVLDKLAELDEIAYLRFASVFKDFDTVADVQQEMESLT